MDSTEQAAGEKRVRNHLFAPLERLGLTRPPGMKVAGFEGMKAEICAKLAYMSETDLASLAEQIQSNPAGPNKDRFPSGPLILTWAADISPPSDSASPLLRNVFASAIGRQAMMEDWGPELRRWLKKHRQWPKEYLVKSIRDEGASNADQMRRLQAKLDRGERLSDADSRWYNGRAQARDACEKIVALGKSG